MNSRTQAGSLRNGVAVLEAFPAKHFFRPDGSRVSFYVGFSALKSLDYIRSSPVETWSQKQLRKLGWLILVAGEPEPVEDASEAAAEVGEGGDVGEAGDLAVGGEELEGDPDEESGACGEVDPGEAEKHAETDAGKGKRVEGDDGGDAAAGTDGGKLATGFKHPVEGVAEDGACEEDEKERFAADGVLDVVTKYEEEVEVAGEMEDSAVNEEGGEPG